VFAPEKGERKEILQGDKPHLCPAVYFRGGIYNIGNARRMISFSSHIAALPHASTFGTSEELLKMRDEEEVSQCPHVQ